MDSAYAKDVAEVLSFLKTNQETGLTTDQIAERLLQYGRNELPTEEPKSLSESIKEQFEDTLVITLLVAAFISFALALFEEGDERASGFIEPFIIFLILIANAIVGIMQEKNAEEALQALKNYSPEMALVIRNSLAYRCEAAELVPGDIISVRTGDGVPADCRVIHLITGTIKVDQSILTGESVSVTKDTESQRGYSLAKQEQKNMIFSGTTITSGAALAVVVQTGIKTAIGDIHQSIQSQTEVKTPLKKKLDEFGSSLGKIITIICILVWIVSIPHFNDEIHRSWIRGAVYYFKVAVALAVAAIPEGLSVIITTCLALGTREMAKKNAIVRSLPSVETLGCTTVICSDKTGTLTTNKMSVQKFMVVGKEFQFSEYDVEGSSYSPYGEIFVTGTGRTIDGLGAQSPVAYELATICSLCNQSKLLYDPKSDDFHQLGDPTEAALRVLVEKIKTNKMASNDSLRNLAKSQRVEYCNKFIETTWDRRNVFEFSRDRKSMSVLVVPRNKKNLNAESNDIFNSINDSPPSSPVLIKMNSVNNNSIQPELPKAAVLVKGAPESILERCKYYRFYSNNGAQAEKGLLNAIMKDKIIKYITKWAQEKAYRLIAFAVVDETLPLEEYDATDQTKYIQYESDMTFIGVVGMLDPPRPEVFQAIKKCKSAGIDVIVVTGDSKHTAESICKAIGVFQPGEDLKGKSYTGAEFGSASKELKMEMVSRAKLFSRTDPLDKQELVDCLQKMGHVVAMTGDGVNDAPALKKADIGISMGTGTAVARYASDLILSDSNFSTIVNAVEEGRVIFNNTRQFIQYLISSNIGEVVCIFLTTLIGLPGSLSPVQLLWVNLVTDGLPATALGFNPPTDDVMKQPPRDSEKPIVTGWLFFRYMIVGIYVGLSTVLGYIWWFVYYEGGPRISLYHLTHFSKCNDSYGIDCAMFSDDRSKFATTMALSVLVTVEMFNAMNSVSGHASLLKFPLWRNMYLIYAIVLSMFLHVFILYFPYFSRMFSVMPLNWTEWKVVLFLSFPVIFLDECLKLFGRRYCGSSRSPATSSINDSSFTKTNSSPDFFIITTATSGTGTFQSPILNPRQLAGYTRLVTRDVELNSVKND